MIVYQYLLLVAQAFKPGNRTKFKLALAKIYEYCPKLA